MATLWEECRNLHFYRQPLPIMHSCHSFCSLEKPTNDYKCFPQKVSFWIYKQPRQEPNCMSESRLPVWLCSKGKLTFQSSSSYWADPFTLFTSSELRSNPPNKSALHSISLYSFQVAIQVLRTNHTQSLKIIRQYVMLIIYMTELHTWGRLVWKGKHDILPNIIVLVMII